jgi:hypothetical protein
MTNVKVRSVKMDRKKVLTLTLLLPLFGFTHGPGENLEVVDDVNTTAGGASAGSVLNECLYYDVRKSYRARFRGKSSDDHYPMNGKTPTRVDLQVQVKGHGNATISKQDSNEVVVHYWYDLFSKLTYHLKVWVEC